MTLLLYVGLIGILFALVFIGCSDDTPNEQEVKDEYAALTRAGKTDLSSRGEESRSTNERYKLIEYPTIQGTSDGNFIATH